jgi:H+/Cl- antiporter ClcA
MSRRDLLVIFKPTRVELVYILLLLLIALVAFFAPVAYGQGEFTAVLTESAGEIEGWKTPIAAILGSLIVIGFGVWAGSALVKR